MNEALRPPDAAPRGVDHGPRSWTSHRPEPRNLWIRWRPRRWAVGESVFVDLAAVCFATDSWEASPAGSFAQPEVESLDDTVYVPCGGASLTESRRELAERLVAAGLPVVLQVSPEGGMAEPDWERGLEARARAQGCDVLRVADLTALLLRDQIGEGVLEVLAGTIAVLPLLPGVLDRTRFAALASDLSRHAVRGVHLVAIAASPATRRRIADHLERERDYRALFHARSPDERELARIALDHGLAVALPRPLPRATRRLRTNRVVAGHLAEAGDLWSRLEPSGREAASFFRAARFVDDSPHDLEALARDGNLHVFEWLEPAPRELVEETLREGKARMVEELRTRWLRGGGEGR